MTLKDDELSHCAAGNTLNSAAEVVSCFSLHPLHICSAIRPHLFLPCWARRVDMRITPCPVLKSLTKFLGPVAASQRCRPIRWHSHSFVLCHATVVHGHLLCLKDTRSGSPWLMGIPTTRVIRNHPGNGSVPFSEISISPRRASSFRNGIVRPSFLVRT